MQSKNQSMISRKLKLSRLVMLSLPLLTTAALINDAQAIPSCKACVAPAPSGHVNVPAGTSCFTCHAQPTVTPTPVVTPKPVVTPTPVVTPPKNEHSDKHDSKHSDKRNNEKDKREKDSDRKSKSKHDD